MADEIKIGRIQILKHKEFSSREEVLIAMTEELVHHVNVSLAQRIAKSMWDREASMPTYLESGLALPHARVQGLEELSIMAAWIPQGVPWPDCDRMAELIIFLYLPESFVSEYLIVMRKLMLWLKDISPSEKASRWGDSEYLKSQIMSALA